VEGEGSMLSLLMVFQLPGELAKGRPGVGGVDERPRDLRERVGADICPHGTMRCATYMSIGQLVKGAVKVRSSSAGQFAER
jgi:hypothetical protein